MDPRVVSIIRSWEVVASYVFDLIKGHASFDYLNALGCIQIIACAIGIVFGKDFLKKFVKPETIPKWL